LSSSRAAFFIGAPRKFFPILYQLSCGVSDGAALALRRSDAGAARSVAMPRCGVVTLHRVVVLRVASAEFYFAIMT